MQGSFVLSLWDLMLNDWIDAGHVLSGRYMSDGLTRSSASFQEQLVLGIRSTLLDMLWGNQDET